MSDEAVLEILDSAPNIETNKIEETIKLGPNLICKFTSAEKSKEELAALDHALKIGLKVPVVRRVIHTSSNWETIIIMDYVHGRTLEQMWPEIGIIDTIRYALQLRKAINVMHKSKSVTGGGLATGEFFTKWFDNYDRPEPGLSPTRLTAYINWWLVNGHEYPHEPDLTIAPLETHTFVHQDLVPRNMIVDKAQQLWIVDWGYAGYYPEFFEYAQLYETKFGKPIEGSRAFTETFWRWKWVLFCVMAIDFRALKVRKLHEFLHNIASRTRAGIAPSPHTDY